MKQKMQMVYAEAQKYLLEMLPDSMQPADLDKYFIGDRRDFSTLQDVYEQFIYSAQNYQAMPNVIKYDEKRGQIKKILLDYNFYQIKEMNVDELYQTFRKEFNVTSRDSKQNSWRKWSCSVIDAAKFMSNFKNVDDFRAFVAQFDYNLPTRMALPLLISTKIKGIGFALACDTLKELGYLNYPKPDVHLIEVFSQIGLSEADPISVFEAIVAMADACKDIDADVTPYKIDKIIWLICSGKFYLDDISVGGHKKQFIEYMKTIHTD